MSKSLRDYDGLSRRQFLAMAAGSSAAVYVGGGCATNPVTGRSQMMFMSESMEIEQDSKWASHQFSSDYGASQDKALNAYVTRVGEDMASLTHRPGMPYNYRVLNAVVVNGYTFPAGSMGLARGLMLEMQNEAQLAAVLGHELGHVNARHAGARFTKGVIAQLLVTGITVYAQQEHEKYAPVAAGLGMLGSNLLLCRYSRNDEREADSLGMTYMSQADYNPKGMAGLMDTFVKAHDSAPSTVEVLFSTHPMSQDRYDTAVERIETQYADMSNRSEHRQRYMDEIAGLRRIASPIKKMQRGQSLMFQKKFKDAESAFRAALKEAPEDYAGLLMMAKCAMAQKKHNVAEEYAKRAQAVYPEEAQAIHVAGMSQLKGGNLSAALSAFDRYETMLPGNDNTIFLKGVVNERMGHKDAAAKEYLRYHASAPNGECSSAVTQRLTDWGYIEPPAPAATQQ
jgi:predicted Zn-dependent protease